MESCLSKYGSDLSGYFSLKTTRSPFAPVDNQVGIKTPETATGINLPVIKKQRPKKLLDIKVDLDGIQNRIVELPVNASNYGGITCFGKKIYYHERKSGSVTPSIKMFDLDKKEERSWLPA
ncbi:MAG: hypothetical protein U5L72_08510 [Bacteroidales bacterium]|nr:hypothetical protein [Bacteroidales bacterium]